VPGDMISRNELRVTGGGAGGIHAIKRAERNRKDAALQFKNWADSIVSVVK